MFHFDWFIVGRRWSWGGRPRLDPVRRFPPYFRAYERQLAKQRYFSRERFTRPETTIRSRSSRRRAPLTTARPGSRTGNTRTIDADRRSPVRGRPPAPDGPPGTTGIEGQVIEGGRSGVVAELAFNRRARITPHSNPNWTYFLVIEGGGWVGVGDERTRVTAGEAVVWPPDVIHAA